MCFRPSPSVQISLEEVKRSRDELYQEVKISLSDRPPSYVKNDAIVRVHMVVRSCWLHALPPDPSTCSDCPPCNPHFSLTVSCFTFSLTGQRTEGKTFACRSFKWGESSSYKFWEANSPASSQTGESCSHAVLGLRCPFACVRVWRRFGWVCVYYLPSVWNV